MTFTRKEKLEFVKKGYLSLPGVADRDKVATALRAINLHLGLKSRSEHPPDRVPFFTELMHEPALMDLLTQTPLWAAVEDLIGRGRLEMPQAEVTLGFPNADGDVMFNAKEWHIDGFPDKGRYQETYTLNAGLFLSDVPGPCMGNFKVLPGSHVRVAEHARRHGHAQINAAVSAMSTGEPEQLRVRAGDAVLCHFNLIHAREWNSTPNVRYAVFFRIKRVGHLARWERALREPWLEWDGLKGLSEPAARRRRP